MMKKDSEFTRRIRDAIRLANRNGFVGTEAALRLLESSVEDTDSGRIHQISAIRYSSMKHTRHRSSIRISESKQDVY